MPPKPLETAVMADADGPEEGAPAADPCHPEPVEHHATRHLQQRIRPEERAEQQADLLRRQVEVLLQLRRSDGEIDPVDVVDQHTGAEQHTDHPTPSRDVLPVWCHSRIPPQDAFSRA